MSSPVANGGGLSPYDRRILGNLNYQSCYCEENVFKLVEKFDQHGYGGYAIFITSVSQKTPVWYQKSSPEPTSPVVWDYHVIYLLTHVPHAPGTQTESHHYQQQTSSTPVASLVPLSRVGSPVLVFDQDSTLPFPCPATDYCKMAFQFGKMVMPLEHELRFRVVDSKSFLRHFASDRRHMRVGQRWMAQPPSWALIQGAPLPPQEDTVGSDQPIPSTIAAVSAPAARPAMTVFRSTAPAASDSTRHNLPSYLAVAGPLMSPGSDPVEAASSDPKGAVLSLNHLYKFVLMCDKCK
jgi:hypothetical protein